LRTELFDYHLPEDRIARFPTEARDGARLLVLHQDEFADSMVVDWPNLLAPRSLVVLNDTRVFKARLLGNRHPTGGRVELLLLEELDPQSNDAHRRHWRAIGRSNRPLLPGAVLDFQALTGTVLEREANGDLRIVLESAEPMDSALDAAGHVPIPPYLGRDDDNSDVERYQTVFARHSGSVAAPTAGLHLSESVLAAVQARGIEVAYTTLHVGIGTFRPVVAADLDEHPMHSERFEVNDELVRAIAAARARNAPVIAVGTTVVRALESAANPEQLGHVHAQSGATRLLIQPGYAFRVVDGLLTNFHMPKSTLLALVGAFVGLERLRQAYEAALARNYRFLSYGDAMWIPQRI